MLKEATNKEKFLLLREWHFQIFEDVKKDLKNEHLRQDPLFLKRFFESKNLQKMTIDDLVEGYRKAVEEGEKADEIADFITNSWLLKYGDIYQHFEKELSKINPDFASMQELDHNTSQQIIEESVRQFGAPQTYLFSVFNSVVFPKEVFHQLNERAKNEVSQAKAHEEKAAEAQSAQALKTQHEKEIARLTEKYEKKLSGLQRKYLNDMEAMKKQVAALQRKLK